MVADTRGGMMSRLTNVSPRKLTMYGLLAALIGGGLFFSFDTITTAALRSQLNLDPNGPLYPNWKTAPIPVYYKFHFFNIDNPNEALNGEKLRVSERGPYAFKQWRRKEIIEWSADRSRLKYYEYKAHYFDPEASVGSLDDEIVTINPLVATFGATIAKLLKEDLPIPMVLSPFLYGTINGLFGIHGEGLFTKQTARELIYGKRVGMLDTITSLMRPLDLFGIKLEQFPKEALPPNNTVGLLYGRNDTPEGPYEVWTGLGGEGSTAEFISWKGNKRLKFWKTDQCNAINGTDGSLFRPGLTKDDKLYAFGADLCRSFSLDYVKESEFKGIPTLQFTVPKTLLQSIDMFPPNDCYCLHKDKSKCRVNGIYDLGGCQFGAPLVAALPHFLNAPHLQNLVDGLNPSEEKHASVVEVQPQLGAVVYGVKRLMFAVRVESNPNLRSFRNIRSVYVPFVWAEESGGLNEELADMVKMTFVYPVTGASVTLGSVGVVGVLLLLLAVFNCFTRRGGNSQPPQPEIPPPKDYGPNIYANEPRKVIPSNTWNDTERNENPGGKSVRFVPSPVTDALKDHPRFRNGMTNGTSPVSNGNMNGYSMYPKSEGYISPTDQVMGHDLNQIDVNQNMMPPVDGQTSPKALPNN